ncbi:MAG TPA: ATP-dependent DNA helicase RecQ [Bryobacteraceae bacterium]|nr:ATP-dependent DNA helicase RecQ [Bryobacteraceae bacterium]
MSTRKSVPKKKKPQSISTRKKTGDNEIQAVARDQFSFSKLRPGQLESIAALLRKRDSLVVMPTGSGKSAIYQIAGKMLPGPVLVVSPLIALQKDQVDSLNAGEGSAEAVVINSSLKAAELRENLESVAEGRSKFIFCAPEQLHKTETLEALERAGVSMIAIDEVHCISEWGHDFRPDYLRLGHVVELLHHPVVVGMTATASERVRAEVIERLGMRNPFLYIGGFDRPNIYLRVDHFEEKGRKLEALIHRVRWTDKPGIVYVATRKNAEAIMQGLKEDGIEALFYHGGLKGPERNEIQDRFMSGEAEVIVATNAFGMGIDKADVRFVYHHDVPDSLDSYYQEIGRAGRDGKPAEAALFFRNEDIGAQAFHTGGGKTNANELAELAQTIEEASGPVSPEEIAEKTGVSGRKITAALQKLEDVEAIEVLPSGEVQLEGETDWEETKELITEQEEKRKEANKRRLEEMRAYADLTTCRREYLLRYFGDEFRGPCGNCDVCDAAVQTNPAVMMERNRAAG